MKMSYILSVMDIIRYILYVYHINFCFLLFLYFHASVSDSITSTSCVFVVQQVVRLAVRLADCCMQLAVDLPCDKLSNLL